MYPELSAIGFHVASRNELITLLNPTEPVGERNTQGFDLVALTMDPSGAKVTMNERNGHLCLDAGLLSPFRMPARVFRLTQNLAHVDIISDDWDTPEARFLAYVDDPRPFPERPFRDGGPFGDCWEGEVSVSAQGTNVQVFDSIATFQNCATGGEFLAPGHLFSPWTFSLYQGKSQQHDATGVAMLGVICRRVELRINALTKQQFYYIEGETGLNTPVTLALPAGVAPAPRPGCVVSGHAVMSVSEGSLEAKYTQHAKWRKVTRARRRLERTLRRTGVSPDRL